MYKSLRRGGLVIGLVALAVCFGLSAARADYRLERVGSGFTQPTYISQAPGDPDNLYITERRAVSTSTKLGRVLKFNIATRTSTTLLDFGTKNVVGDAAVASMAFSPDFTTDNTFYLAWNEGGTGGGLGTSHVEKYTLSGGVATLAGTVLQYQSGDSANNHTVDWIGFDPTATGPARNYLYITTGDGGPQANIPTYVPKSQNLNDVRGKVLRVDPTGTDAYLGDANKNFAIPATNPIPAGGGSGLGEVFLSGLRNPWRASFDTANGDFYIGDVGRDDREEIDFLKAGQTGVTAGVPVDYGWPKREGTITNPVGTVAGAQGDSLNPIIERTQPTDQSITGGIVYHGAVADFQNLYVFGDYQVGHSYSAVFDRNSDPATWNGTQGVVTNLDAAWLAKTNDPTNPAYTSLTSGFGIQRPVSFATDNAGQLYVIDFGTGGVGAGEIFRLTPKLDGDFDDDADVDAADIDMLWHIVRGTGTDFNANDSANLNADGFVNEDDVDYLLANLLTSGTGRAYGDADVDGDVDGVDFDSWRTRPGYTGAGTGKWSAGDFDGDGDVDGADFELWRTRPTTFPTNVGPHAGDPLGVPEPATALPLLFGLLALIARRRAK